MDFFQVFLGPWAIGFYFYLDLFHVDKAPSFLSKILFFLGVTSAALCLGIINYHWFQFKNELPIFWYYLAGSGAGASVFLLQKTTHPFSFSSFLLLSRSSLLFIFFIFFSLLLFTLGK